MLAKMPSPFFYLAFHSYDQPKTRFGVHQIQRHNN